ncbi:MAG: molybdopterin molybdotransferase MoeA [Geminicoccaceae bacterium]|nr:molybdopterin molybdotransferase MoeA [Geminicoccaceae bacterium]
MALDDALALLRARIVPVAGVVDARLDAAAGGILAEDVVSPDDLPRFDNAAVDGYAFAGAALAAGGETRLRLRPGRAAAGHPFADEVPEGSCVRTLTGAPMPNGTDTVVMQEEAGLEGDAVTVPAGFRAGSNRRMRGEDIRAGQALFAAGLRLAPHHLGVLAGLGGDRVRLRAPLRVALCSSGDELREPGANLPPGGVYDANRHILKGLLRHLPVTVTDLGILPDERGKVEAVLKDAAAAHDLVLASGGASRGDEDHVVRAVEKLGRLHFWRIAMKPGRPLAFGELGGAVFVGLPGNPVATTVCFLRLARPVLLRLAGSAWTEPKALPVPAAFTMKKRPGRTELLRGRLVPGTNGYAVLRIRREGSGILTSLTDADGLIEIGAGVEEVKEGDPVPYFSFAELGAL